MPKPTDLVLLSGGLDSTTLLAAHTETTGLVLSVDYGQRHARELDAAHAVATHYQVEHKTVDFTAWGALLSGSALTDSTVPVPHGHYADASMAVTIVPNRNAVLLMAAVGIAVSRGLSRVLTAVHAGDHPIYPDCRPDFIAAIDYAALLATSGKVSIVAPFSNFTKTDIARVALKLNTPVALTWSCYEGGVIHCGVCGTCTERREAFRDAGIGDPTQYQAVA
jgi:7-cyano-7-deazaguanine synthase